MNNNFLKNMIHYLFPLMLLLTMLPMISYAAPTARISISNVIMDGNQYLNLTGYVTGGLQPYTYNFIISNAITNSIIISQQYTGVSASSNSFIWQVPSADTGNTIGANVIITDNAPNTANSVKILPLMINPQFQSTEWTASQFCSYSGQMETLSSAVSGGTNSITSAQFNGAGYIQTVSGYPAYNAITVTLWMDPYGTTSNYQFPFDDGGISGIEGTWRMGFIQQITSLLIVGSTPTYPFRLRYHSIPGVH